MYTNKKAIVIISAILYLSTPLSIFANEESNNSIQNSKSSVITFKEITKNDFQKEKKSQDMKIPEGVVFEDSKVAFETDVAILSKETGYSIESIEKAILFQQAFGIYADKILSRYPNQISSIWTEKIPSTIGHITFVKEVPKEIALEVKKHKQDDKIILTSNGGISLKDNHKRAVLVSKALSELKYQNTITFFDQIKNLIHIEIQISDNEKEPLKSDFIDAIKAQIEKSQLKGRSTSIDENDLELVTFRGTGNIISLDSSRGGAELRNNGIHLCTNGWSVVDLSHYPPRLATLTAGHCVNTNINEIIDHETSNVSNIQLIAQEFGADGDVASYTTDDNEIDDFYASSTSIRDVSNVKTTNSMVGNNVCMYGRASNTRTCNHTVEATYVNVDIGNITIGSLVRVNSTNSIPGDSGGGWSWGGTAWGVNHGHGTGASSGKGYFTGVEEALEAIGAWTIR